MQVTAFSTPTLPDWRWRIVDYDGGVIEESQGTFPTIAAAVAEGTKRLLDLSRPPAHSTWRRPR